MAEIVATIAVPIKVCILGCSFYFISLLTYTYTYKCIHADGKVLFHSLCDKRRIASNHCKEVLSDLIKGACNHHDTAVVPALITGSKDMNEKYDFDVHLSSFFMNTSLNTIASHSSNSTNSSIFSTTDAEPLNPVSVGGTTSSVSFYTADDDDEEDAEYRRTGWKTSSSRSGGDGNSNTNGNEPQTKPSESGVRSKVGLIDRINIIPPPTPPTDRSDEIIDGPDYVNYGDIPIGDMNEFTGENNVGIVIKLIGQRIDEDEIKYLCLEGSTTYGGNAIRRLKRWIVYEDACKLLGMDPILMPSSDVGEDIEDGDEEDNYSDHEMEDDNPFFGGNVILL